MCSDVLPALTAIPPFPSLAGEILQWLPCESGSLRRIVSLLEKDAAMTRAVPVGELRVLRRQHVVASVQASLQVWDTDVSVETVVQVSVRAYAERGMPPEDPNRCWAHSLVCAEISRILAIAAELLHDLGGWDWLCPPRRFIPGI